MHELGALLPILPYALSVGVLVALLHKLASWSDGPSLADLVSGPRDLAWPQGVQEEEPVRWHIEALRPRRDHRRGEVTRTKPDPRRSVAPGPRPCQAARPGA